MLGVNVNLFQAVSWGTEGSDKSQKTHVLNELLIALRVPALRVGLPRGRSATERCSSRALEPSLGTTLAVPVDVPNRKAFTTQMIEIIFRWKSVIDLMRYGKVREKLEKVLLAKMA